jgi:hypothetical protein
VGVMHNPPRTMLPGDQASLPPRTGDQASLPPRMPSDPVPAPSDGREGKETNGDPQTQIMCEQSGHGIAPGGLAKPLEVERLHRPAHRTRKVEYETERGYTRNKHTRENPGSISTLATHNSAATQARARSGSKGTAGSLSAGLRVGDHGTSVSNPSLSSKSQPGSRTSVML